ncbi:MAG: glycosyltransferase family 1 protein, partial [Chitinophagaceae bacterium]
MKYPHTGLYQFCLHLSKALIKLKQDQLCFYTPSSVGDIFGKYVCYLRQKSLHKLFFPSVKNIALWHCAHQSSNYFPFRKDVKKVLTIHDLNYLNDERKDAAKKKKFAADLQRKIDAADHLAFISHFTKTDVDKHFDLTNKPTSVIYNGCTIEELPLITLPSFLPSKPYLFTLGTITEKKNFHVLPRLLTGNDFLLVIAGITQNESYKERIIQEARKNGVADRIVFTGPVNDNDKQWYLKNCAAFVFPSIAEGFGLPVIEAMYFGKPVLLSKATSLPEIGGTVAEYFADFSQEEMQKALLALLQRFGDNPSLQAAVEQRASLFSWEEAAKQY